MANLLLLIGGRHQLQTASQIIVFRASMLVWLFTLGEGNCKCFPWVVLNTNRCLPNLDEDVTENERVQSDGECKS